MSIQRLGVSLCVTAVVVLAAELLLRACTSGRYGPKAPIAWELGNGGTGAALNDLSRGLWRPRPGAKDPWGETIGPDGCRGPSYSASEGRLRVLALGDSSTYGYGLVEAQAWPRRMEVELRARGLPVDVVNGGVIGYTVVQGRVRFEELAPTLRPHVVLLAFGAVNEHFGAPGGLRDSRRVELWSRRIPWSDRLRRESALVQLAADLIRGGETLRQAEEDPRRPRDAWGALDYQGERRVSPAEFVAELRGLCSAVRQAGAEPVLVSMPRRADFEMRKPVLASYTAAVEQVAQEASAACVDARGALASWSAKEAYLPNDRVHPTSAGHARIAELATEVVAEMLERR
jgi:lysophospholipase L1-like esterase